MIGWIDPRARLGFGLGLALLAATLPRLDSLLFATALGLLLSLRCGTSLADLLRRLAPLNGFMLVLVLVLPWTIPGESIVSLGAWSYSRTGLAAALRTTLQANAILLLVVGPVASLDMVQVGHALGSLHLPTKLVQLVIQTVRYIVVLQDEYGRMTWAARLRGFRPAISVHTFRTVASLLSTLLVRAAERSERIDAAMRCRGFDGRFHVLDEGRIGVQDWAYGLAASVGAIGMVWP